MGSFADAFWRRVVRSSCSGHQSCLVLVLTEAVLSVVDGAAFSVGSGAVVSAAGAGALASAVCVSDSVFDWPPHALTARASADTVARPIFDFGFTCSLHEEGCWKALVNWNNSKLLEVPALVTGKNLET